MPKSKRATGPAKAHAPSTKPAKAPNAIKQAQSSAKLARLLQDRTRSNTLSAADLRHNSAEILSRVALGGERLIITRNRKAVAALVPLSDYESLKKTVKK
jgi:prevent-host-death family protein